ncbi:MAG: hypothetical protein QOG34_1573 [Frankiaceae bacterium]|nr:hypothetical protein [Frankiaceae bacterium]
MNCGVITNPTAVFTPSPGGGGTVTLAIPLHLCLTTGPVPAGGCFGAAPTVGSTGVVVGTFAVMPPPAGYSTGGGLTLTGVSVIVNGTSVPLLGGASAQVGANPAVVGAGVGPGTIPICLLSVCAPGLWVGEQPISAAAIVVDGIPVAIPPVSLGCVVNLNTSCPPPY